MFVCNNVEENITSFPWMFHSQIVPDVRIDENVSEISFNDINQCSLFYIFNAEHCTMADGMRFLQS